VKIIIALDSIKAEKNIEIATSLKGKVDGFKINHLMWENTRLLKSLADELFIDCKLWDTPNTVEQVLRRIKCKGATMTTVNTFNNNAVFEACQKYADDMKILGVTYLTSWDSSELLNITNQNAKVIWRSAIDSISNYGFSGVICSPKDLDTVKPLAPNMLKVCPGIGNNPGQTRTVTAKEALNMGADYIVVGRTVTNAENPVSAVEEMKESLLL
tara:strand:- start:9967 stop:10608 length:642 start_codon:yes stop_codon:yes gene_type:complete